MSCPDHATYRLTGEKADAARELIALEQEIIDESAFSRSNDQIAFRLLRRDVMDEIRRRRPDLIESLGLNIPATVIEQHEGGHPRAYIHYPHLGVIENAGETSYFMLTPIGYNGFHHKPAGGSDYIEPREFAAGDFGELVYKRHGFVMARLISNKEGTALPADFDPGRHEVRRMGVEGRRYKVFIAGGASLECVKDYLRRMEEFKQAHAQGKPDLGQYWQIHNPTASGLKGHFHSQSKDGDRVPKIDTIRGVHYLVYLMDEQAEKDHCHPPGGIPVSLAEYLWLKADIRDEENLISQPDPPPQLAHMRPVKFATPPAP